MARGVVSRLVFPRASRAEKVRFEAVEYFWVLQYKVSRFQG